MEKYWIVSSYNKRYFLKVGNKIYECQVGGGGFKIPSRKIEGDKATPIGLWQLESIYYRSDRILRPRSNKKNVLKINRITRNCGWCNDPESNYYNRYIKINKCSLKKTNYEKLWREDNVYDIFLEINHNKSPSMKNKGSAIFIHCSFNDKRTTAGCVALQKSDLIFLLNNLKGKVCIRIFNRYFKYKSLQN